MVGRRTRSSKAVHNVSHNALYASMRYYGYCELLMRLKPSIIFNQGKIRINPDVMPASPEAVKQTIKGMLSEAYARKKLRAMNMEKIRKRGGRGKVEFMEIEKVIDAEELDAPNTLYMALGLLEGKGYKRYDGGAGEETKVKFYDLLLALLGRVYYSVVAKVGRSTAFVSFRPNGAVTLEAVLHVRGLVGRFETMYGNSVFMKLGEVPDIAKPYVISLLLDQNALLLASKAMGGYFDFNTDYVILENRRNFREYATVPLRESANLAITLGKYQKPLANLVRGLTLYGHGLESLPTQASRMLSRLAYALMNRDGEALAELNLEVLKDENVSKYALSDEELVGICKALESFKA